MCFTKTSKLRGRSLEGRRVPKNTDTCRKSAAKLSRSCRTPTKFDGGGRQHTGFTGTKVLTTSPRKSNAKQNTITEKKTKKRGEILWESFKLFVMKKSMVAVTAGLMETGVVRAKIRV